MADSDPTALSTEFCETTDWLNILGDWSVVDNSAAMLLIERDDSQALGNGGTGGTSNVLCPPTPPSSNIAVASPKPALLVPDCTNSAGKEMSLPRLLFVEVEVRGAAVEVIDATDVPDARLLLGSG